MVSEAWGVPLGNDKCIVERDKVLGMIEDIKSRIPAELAEAKRLVSARDEFIGNAKREAESIRRAAEEKARAMVDEQEIVRVARAKAAEMESTAAAARAALRQAAHGVHRRRAAPRRGERLRRARRAAHFPRPLPRHRRRERGPARRPAKAAAGRRIAQEEASDSNLPPCAVFFSPLYLDAKAPAVRGGRLILC